MAVSVGFRLRARPGGGPRLGNPIAFAAVLAAAPAGGGVAVQPLARRLARRDRPHQPWLLVTGMALVTAGLLAEAGMTAASAPGPWQSVLALLASAELGCGYAITQVFGLTEVALLAGLTGVFQVACYTGSAVPDILSLPQATAPAPLLLLGLATLAVLTLAATTWQTRCIHLRRVSNTWLRCAGRCLVGWAPRLDGRLWP